MLNDYLIHGMVYCCNSCTVVKPIHKGRINSARHVVVAIDACMVTLSIFGSSVWNIRHVTCLTPRHFRWLIDF